LVDLSGLAEIHSLWIGERLSWIERVSIHSWLEHGHRVTLWCFDPIEGVPNGVSIADAATILPKTSIIRHRQTQSVSLFSNRFRYHLLKRMPATWLDSDMVLLRPLNDASPYLFGWEMATRIGTAVLRLPPGVGRFTRSQQIHRRACRGAAMVAPEGTTKATCKRIDWAASTR
jgi:hypothetical protein